MDNSFRLNNIGVAMLIGLAAWLFCFTLEDGAFAVPNGQLYYAIVNGGPDGGIHVINSDGTSQTNISTAFTLSMAVDTAAGLLFSTTGADYFTVRRLRDGALISSNYFGPHTGNANIDDAVEAIAVDPIAHKLYVGDWGTDNNSTGIRVYTYNPANGALTAQASNGGFLFTATQTETTPGNDATTRYTTPWHFSLDVDNHKLYYADNDNGYALSPYHPVNSVYVVDLNAGTPLPALLTTFPSGSATGGSGGGGLDAVYTKGLMGQIVVDPSHNLVYFATSQSQPVLSGGTNHSYDAVYYVSATPTGVSQTATRVTLAGFPVALTNSFFPFESGTLLLDPTLDQIYIADQNHDGVHPDPSSYIVAQVSADGHTFTFVKTNGMALLAGHPITNTVNGDLYDTAGNGFFNPLPVLSVTGTNAHAAEQGGYVDLTLANTSSDHFNGYYNNAIVQITGGTFSSNESSANDDHLSVLDGVTHRTSGVFTGTSISVAYDSATEKLMLSGYDTIANYNTVLGLVQYNTTGDNPSNYGSNATRTISWTVSDGATNVAFGAQNSISTTLTIDVVNDAPTNTVPGAQTATEDVAKSITGLSVTDVDASPSSQNITLTLAVLHGTVTVRTDVASGVTAGGVAGNGTASAVLTATQNAINTTLAAANGVLYQGNTNYFGADTLTVTANDQGHTGTPGALQDQDTVAITVNPVADTPNITGTTTREDTQTGTGLVISRNPADSTEVTHFKITGITGGSLFQNDGTTAIVNNQFITFAQANAGLRFTPLTNTFSPGTTFGFNIQASLSASDAGLGGGVVPAVITVYPVADTPGVTGATTLEGRQTTNGLVISRNPADGAEVTHFKITGIQNGALFLNDGTTQIASGSFVTFAQGNAGLKFTPTPVLYSPSNNFGFSVQASTNAADVGLGGGIVNATIIVNPNYDFGDAPAPYPTLLANDGARHVTPSTGAALFLGNVPPDIETNGQPNATATGDGSDEDGVQLPVAFTNTLPASVTVVASQAGKLDAWIDFNRDGDWNDAGEQIFTNRGVAAGSNLLTFTVPAISVATNSYARFRLSSAGNLAPTGSAYDGEVEDYQVQLSVNVPPQISCPSDITTNSAGYCPPAVAFASTVTAGIPAPAVSYKLGASTITSPYPFAVGTNLVSVTATNVAGASSCSFNVIVTAGAPPQLSIVRSGTNLVVSWTNAVPCYTLQFATALSSNNWSDYPGPFVTNNGNIIVTNSTATNRFFRLSF